MAKDPFYNGRKIIKKIEEVGEEAYFVGGCVRDLLLKQPTKDIDIATSALPEKIQQTFNNVIPVGIEHGTVIVRYKQESYEVTTFRLDGDYSDNRHPDEVEFVRKLDEDLKRRDFTINAIAMDRHGKIIDLFQGTEDLQKKIIRTVGEGEERFSEDALRMFRAIRFASQLGFTIEKQTLYAIKKCREDIEKVAIERLLNELTRLFAGPYVSNGLYYLQKTKIYKHLPIFSEYPFLIENIQSLKQPLFSSGEIIAYLHYVQPSVSIDDWVKNWKTSNQTRREAHMLIKALNTYEKEGLHAWLIYKLPVNLQHEFHRLIQIFFPKEAHTFDEINAIWKQLPISSRKDLAVSGRDIVTMFPEKKRGPWIEEMLITLEKNVILGKLKNDEQHLKEWMKCNPPTIN